MSTSRLEDLLAEAIPKGVQINVRHVSTPPTRCDAIFSAPPGQTPETTFCESHMLMVTVNRSQDPESTIVDDEVAILGVEVYIYSTDRLTTLFVAKADSTGYVYLSKSRDVVTSSSSSSPPKMSLLRALTSTFISFLARSYQRPGVRLVLSLFARAQNQYLFPGSVDNKRKHVLDDRGLIKWWCRAADPVLREYVAEPKTPEERVREARVVGPAATAYLLVPGCDQYETRAFFPPSARADGIPSRWQVSYPVNAICSHPEAPPRCLIPRFPDDPKARFLTDLDDELSEPSGAGASESTQRESGHWRSVKSLDQFWEMMSFRQECSAGRLVGFLWLVISPPVVIDDLKTSTSHCAAAAAAETPAREAAEVQTTEIPTATTSTEARFDDRTLSALCAPPKNEPSTQPPTNGSATCRSPFFWPEIGRGEIILSETDYKLANDVLLEQDFETEELAMTATIVWIRKVASVADVLWWGTKVTGRKQEMDTVQQPSESSPTVTPGLIVRKRKKENEGFQSDGVDLEGDDTRDPDKASSAETVSKEGGVNILTATFIRKKKKT